MPPPPRPPAPTLSFNKKQSSLDDAQVVSIRFNRTDDDYDDVDVTMMKGATAAAATQNVDTSMTSQLARDGGKIDSKVAGKSVIAASNKVDSTNRTPSQGLYSSDGTKVLRRAATADNPPVTNMEVKPKLPATAQASTASKHRSQSTSDSPSGETTKPVGNKHVFPGLKNGNHGAMDHNIQSAPVSQVTTPQDEVNDSLVKNSRSTQDKGFVLVEVRHLFFNSSKSINHIRTVSSIIYLVRNSLSSDLILVCDLIHRP